MTTWLKKSLIMRQNSQLLDCWPSCSVSAASAATSAEAAAAYEKGRPTSDLWNEERLQDNTRAPIDGAHEQRPHRRLGGDGIEEETGAQERLESQQVISIDAQAIESPPLATRLMSQNGQPQITRRTSTTATTTNICRDIRAKRDEDQFNDDQEEENPSRKNMEEKEEFAKRKKECVNTINSNYSQHQHHYLIRKVIHATSQAVIDQSQYICGHHHPNPNPNHKPQATSTTKKTLMKSSTYSIVLISLLVVLLQTSVVYIKPLAAASASSGQQQYFDGQPEQYSLIGGGQDIRLRCLIRNRLGECAWVHNGLVIGPIKSKYAYQRQPDDGDCSLLIRNASVQSDDGQWQCQVMATELDQPNLQSRQATLVVLVAPEKPQIKDLANNQQQRLVVEENASKSITCEIRGGNPAPLIEWQLDGRNISKEAKSSSSFELVSQQQQQQQQQPPQRITQSRLRLADIKRAMNGKNLTCFGLHQTLNQSTSVELDVQYVPTVNVVQREYSIVEGSPLSITCQVDSNPPPSLIGWRLTKDGPPALIKKLGGPDQQAGAALTTSVGPLLEFQHITRDSNQDTYECFAQNPLGTSSPKEVTLNVLFAPAVVNSSHSESIQVGNSTQLACMFEGNPAPEIKWFYTDPLSKSAATQQLVDGPDTRKAQLMLRNVTYRNEGDYYCEARNYINGQVYSVRSSNILLDVYGEPQFLMKSPVMAKAVQGSKSDVALTFCSDPPPQRVYWQFGSIVLNVRLNGIQPQMNGQQGPPVVGLANSNKQQHQQHLHRFQVHPLQPIQRRDSNFAKVNTCFEATLTLLDPELNDGRDYTLNVVNERGHQAGILRLRVNTPLSPVLMISSAFVTICGLFFCSLLFMFVFKKRRQFLSGAAAVAAANGTGGGSSSSSSSSPTTGHSKRGLRSSQAGKKHLMMNGNGNGNGNSNGGSQPTANGHEAHLTDLHHHQQQREMGVVNGAGNGLANGAGNPVHQLDTEAANSKALHMMSMASSDTSCNDQKQLLAHSDRNSSASGSSTGRIEATAADNSRPSMEHYGGGGGGGGHANPNSIDRSTANSTPSSQMNHISVDDELHLGNGSYQAAESVTRGARLSPAGSSIGHHNHPNHHHLTASNAASALIYANLDYGQNMAANVAHLHSPGQSTLNMGQQQQQQQQHRPPLRRQHTPIGSPTGSISNSSSTNMDDSQRQMGATHSTTSSSPANSINSQTTNNQVRPSVGATIAMMNSLAAAANQRASNSPGSSGVLNGAINQQLANSRQLVRKPGPPKPPKPSIQQRSRFYQQQAAAAVAAAAANGGGTPGGALVMIGTSQLQGADHQQQQQQQQVDSSMDNTPPASSNDLAMEYSRIAFPARAEL